MPMRLKDESTALFGPSESSSLPVFSAVPQMLNKPTVLSAPSDSASPRRWFGVPRSVLLEHRLLSQPMTVVREATVAAAQLLDHSKGSSSKHNRFVFTGPAGSGKTFLLMQAVEHAYQNGWLIVYIPRAESIVSSTYSYQYDLRTRIYLQPSLSRQLIARTLALPSNLSLMKDMTTSRPFLVESGLTGKREWQRGASLVEILRTGAGLAATSSNPSAPGATTTAAPDSASPTFDFLLSEIALQSKVPVLFAIDGIQSLYQPTLYRNPHYERIQPWHLQVSRAVLDLLAGKRELANGAVFSSISYTDPQFPVPSILSDSLQLDPTAGSLPSLPPAYDKTSKELYTYVKGLKAFKVPEAMGVDEASRLFEVWMGKRAGADTAMSDSHFLSKYTESSGNPRDFVWKGLLESLEGNTPTQETEAPWPHLRLIE